MEFPIPTIEAATDAFDDSFASRDREQRRDLLWGGCDPHEVDARMALERVQRRHAFRVALANVIAEQGITFDPLETACPSV